MKPPRAEILLRLHGEFQPRFQHNSSVAAIKIFVSLNISSLRLPKPTFRPGLKFGCDKMRFFSLPARAKTSMK